MAKDLHMIEEYGGDILASSGMQAEKGFLQHGGVSTYAHSVAVAEMCLLLVRKFHIGVDDRSLVRGALLHDYFLYDWHKPHGGDGPHAFFHARQALRNASRDFELNEIERDMILRHMFPLNITPPRYRESVILCLADKICTLRETVAGIRRRKGRRG